MTHATSLALRYDVTTATLAVSGYAPVPAWEVRDLATGQVLGRTATRREALVLVERRTLPLLGPIRAKVGAVNRCHVLTCRTWIWAPVARDGLLGWEGAYCQPCLDAMIRRCERLHGRLPRLGLEFYCPKCELLRIHPEDRKRRDPDGRQRVVCRPCRNAMLNRNRIAREAHRVPEIRLDPEDEDRWSRGRHSL